MDDVVRVQVDAGGDLGGLDAFLSRLYAELLTTHRVVDAVAAPGSGLARARDRLAGAVENIESALHEIRATNARARRGT